jgi:hypothetical protein
MPMNYKLAHIYTYTLNVSSSSQFLIARLCQHGIIAHHVITESTATSPQPAFERATDLLGGSTKSRVDQACGTVQISFRIGRHQQSMLCNLFVVYSFHRHKQNFLGIGSGSHRQDCTLSMVVVVLVRSYVRARWQMSLGESMYRNNATYKWIFEDQAVGSG